MLKDIITSRENPAVKHIVKLSSSQKARKEEGLFVLEGLRLCVDAALNGYALKSAYFTEQFYIEHPDAARSIEESSASAAFVSEAVMDKMSSTVNPQGVIALCEIPRFSNELQKGFYIGLEGIRDPSNLGAISRSAEAFGAKGLILFSASCDPYSPKSLRAGMGALLRLPIIILPSFEEALELCRKAEKKIYASVVDGNAQSIITCDKTENALLIIGNEANGIQKETAERSDARVTIPMKGRAESLNAAAAAALMIWEFLK